MKHIQPINFNPVKPPKKTTNNQWRWFLLKFIAAIFIILLSTVIWFLFSSKSVWIDITPDNAELTIQTRFKLTLAERYLMRKGNYKIEIKAKGHHSLTETLRIDEQQNQQFSYSLIPLPGHLYIDVGNISQARIFIDGIEQGPAPITIKNIKAGIHKISIKTARYLPYERKIEIKGEGKTQTLSAELIPAWAEIIIDDSVIETTPATIELLQGKHNIRLRKAKFKEWRKTIDIIAGENIKFDNIKLQPADAILFITSTPSAANVTIDGDYAGKTPIEVAIEPNKKNSIKLYKQGYITKTKDITLNAGQSKKLNLSMPFELTDFIFDIKPQDAKLYINGKLTKLTNMTLKLPTTEHNIVVRKTGYIDYETTIVPIKDIAQQVSIKLKTVRQQKLEKIKPIIKTAAGQKLKLFYPYGFTMGASRREPGRRSNEIVKKVLLKRPFYLGINEVTNHEFRLFKKQHNSGNINGQSINNEKQPVVNINWQEAALYCNWLSQQDSLKPFYKVHDGEINGSDSTANGYRLPTEAEWAWAARSINKTELLKFSWGETFPPPQKEGNYADTSATFLLGKTINNYNDGFAVAAPVGSFPANHNGLYDIGGNVAEWMHDYYTIQLSNAKMIIDPLGPTKGEFHVIRGSSWIYSTITELRLSYRDYFDQPREDVGFRIARYLE